MSYLRIFLDEYRQCRDRAKWLKEQGHTLDQTSRWWCFKEAIRGVIACVRIDRMSRRVLTADSQVQPVVDELLAAVARRACETGKMVICNVDADGRTTIAEHDLRQEGRK